MADPRIAAAAMGGYVLGRTKKGRSALRLVMWLNGNTPGQQASQLARTGVTQAMQSEEIAKLVTQVRGPLTDAVQKAAAAMVAQQLTAMSARIEARTKKIQEVGSDLTNEAEQLAQGALPVGDATSATDAVSDTVEKATGGRTKKVTGRLRRRAGDKPKDEGEGEQEQPEDEGDESEGEGESTESESESESESADEGEHV